MKYFADLHMHSTASDGTLTPSELAKTAKRAGLTAAAVTDHDTIDGAEEFMAKCAELGLEGIPGVELSADYGKQMHIVGLFINPNSDELRTELAKLTEERLRRNRKIIAKMNALGFEIAEKDIISQKADGRLDNAGRPHFARALVRKGYAKDTDEAFSKYLLRGKPCYVKRNLPSPKSCIEMIHRADGIAILAHPMFITRDEKELCDILERLKSEGLDGMECYYGKNDTEYFEMSCRAAKNVGLLISGGSDFHGDTKPDVRIGEVNGGEHMPYGVVKKLRRRESN